MQITGTSRRGLVGLLAGLATAATVGAAHAQTTLERAKADGYIRVGFANEAPYGYATPDGKLTGESPEVVKAVLAKMGIAQVDGVLTEFGSLIPGLQAGRFDIIAAGMFITRCICALACSGICAACGDCASIFMYSSPNGARV